MSDDFTALAKFWHYNPVRVVATTGFLFVTVFFEPLAISFMLALLSVILDMSDEPNGLISELVFWLQSKFSTTDLLVLFCGVFALKFASLQLAFWYASRTVAGYSHYLRNNFFSRVLGSSYQSLQACSEARLMSTVGVDSLQAGNSITAALRCLVDLVSLTLYALILMAMAWRAFTVCVVVIAVMFTVTKFIARSTVKAAEDSLAKAHSISEFMKNILGGFRGIRVYGLAPDALRSFKELSVAIFGPHSFNVAVGQYLRNANEVVQVGGLIAVLVTYWVAFGYDGIEILGALALFQRVGASAAQLSGDFNKFQALAPYLRNFDHCFGLKPVLDEKDGSSSLPPDPGFSDLTLESVTFRHSSGRGLKDCSFGASLGEVVLIRGPSGAGKSTLIDCLLGLLDYQDGAVCLGGKVLSPAQLRANCRNVALVEQFPYFGGGHIFKMLLETSEEKRAVFVSCLNCFGLEAIANEIGRMGLHVLCKVDADFSGGERQRIAISLAIAASVDRRFIIFDEPTAALDPANATIFRSLVSRWKKDKIILIVSHDREMVACVDQVVDLEVGDIKQCGT